MVNGGSAFPAMVVGFPVMASVVDQVVLLLLVVHSVAFSDDGFCFETQIFNLSSKWQRET